MNKTVLLEKANLMNKTVLLEKANKLTKEMKRLRTIANEIFKALNLLNILNPSYMKELFSFQHPTKRRQKALLIKNLSTKSYDKQSLSSLGSEIWNSLLEHMKVQTSFTLGQSYINT